MVRSQGGSRVLDQLGAVRGVGKKPDGLCRQVVGVAYFHRPARGEQRIAERGKIFHLRAEEDRATGKDGFDGVLSAGSAEALAHKNRVRAGIPIAQLAGGIEEENIRSRPGVRVGASRYAETGRGEARRDLRGALDVTRGDEEARGGKAGAQNAQALGENFLLSLVGAAAEKDRVGRLKAEARKHGTKVAAVGMVARGVVLHAAGQVQALR